MVRSPGSWPSRRPSDPDPARPLTLRRTRRRRSPTITIGVPDGPTGCGGAGDGGQDVRAMRLVATPPGPTSETRPRPPVERPGQNGYDLSAGDSLSHHAASRIMPTEPLVTWLFGPFPGPLGSPFAGPTRHIPSHPLPRAPDRVASRLPASWKRSPSPPLAITCPSSSSPPR
jgi:hypothetical protein